MSWIPNVEKGNYLEEEHSKQKKKKFKYSENEKSSVCVQKRNSQQSSWKVVNRGKGRERLVREVDKSCKSCKVSIRGLDFIICDFRSHWRFVCFLMKNSKHIHNRENDMINSI